MELHNVVYWASSLSCIHQDLINSSNYFKFILFADDSTLSISFDPSLKSDILARNIDREIQLINRWVIAHEYALMRKRQNMFYFHIEEIPRYLCLKLATIKFTKMILQNL